AAFNLTGGTVAVYLDTDVNSGGALNISGSASFSVTGNMRVLDKGTTSSAMTLSGGTVDITGTFALSGGTGCLVSPSLTVSSGTMTVTGAFNWTQSSAAFCAFSPTTTPIVTVS